MNTAKAILVTIEVRAQLLDELLSGRGASPKAARQARATISRDPWTIPDSWWLPAVAEAMCDWIKRNNPAQPPARPRRTTNRRSTSHG